MGHVGYQLFLQNVGLVQFGRGVIQRSRKFGDLFISTFVKRDRIIGAGKTLRGFVHTGYGRRDNFHYNNGENNGKDNNNTRNYQQLNAKSGNGSVNGRYLRIQHYCVRSPV